MNGVLLISIFFLLYMPPLSGIINNPQEIVKNFTLEEKIGQFFWLHVL